MNQVAEIQDTNQQIVPECEPDFPANAITLPASSGSFLDLRIFAESFEDALKARMAQANRFRSGTVDDNPAVEAALEAYVLAEKKLGLAMRRCFRKVCPWLNEWVKSDAALGIGEHLVARLVGTIGDPFIAQPFHWEESKGDAKRVLVADPPYARSLRQLWSYCGHGAPKRRKKGMSQEEALGLGNPRAKMIVHLMAECTMKTRKSPFRAIYDLARIEYADRVDEAGKPWTAGHQNAAALRKVGKEILREIWVQSRNYHILTEEVTN